MTSGIVVFRANIATKKCSPKQILYTVTPSLNMPPTELKYRLFPDVPSSTSQLEATNRPISRSKFPSSAQYSVSPGCKQNQPNQSKSSPYAYLDKTQQSSENYQAESYHPEVNKFQHVENLNQLRHIPIGNLREFQPRMAAT